MGKHFLGTLRLLNLIFTPPPFLIQDGACVHFLFIFPSPPPQTPIFLTPRGLLCASAVSEAALAAREAFLNSDPSSTSFSSSSSPLSRISPSPCLRPQGRRPAAAQVGPRLRRAGGRGGALRGRDRAERRHRRRRPQAHDEGQDRGHREAALAL